MPRDERDEYLDRDGTDSELMPAAYKVEHDAKRSRLWAPARKLADVAFLERIEADYELSQLPCRPFERPTLIVAGRQDTRVGFEEAISTTPVDVIGVSMAKQYPRATLAALDRAGHLLPVGRSDLFDALIRDWLDRMEESL